MCLVKSGVNTSVRTSINEVETETVIKLACNGIRKQIVIKTFYLLMIFLRTVVCELALRHEIMNLLTNTYTCNVPTQHGDW